MKKYTLILLSLNLLCSVFITSCKKDDDGGSNTSPVNDKIALLTKSPWQGVDITLKRKVGGEPSGEPTIKTIDNIEITFVKDGTIKIKSNGQDDGVGTWELKDDGSFSFAISDCNALGLISINDKGTTEIIELSDNKFQTSNTNEISIPFLNDKGELTTIVSLKR